MLLILFAAMAYSSQEQTISDLKKYMYGIASDATEGRFTGSAGYKKAADFVVSQLKADGLKPLYQPVPFFRDNYNGSSITFVNHTGSRIFRHSAANFVIVRPGLPQKTSLQAPVFIGYGIEDTAWNDYAGVQVTGKWVVMLNGLPSALQTRYSDPDSIKYQALLHHHVAGVILLPDSNVTRDWETTVIRQYRFGYMHYAGAGAEPEKPAIPSILIHPRLARELFKSERYDPLGGTGTYHAFVLTTKLAVCLNKKREHINSCNIMALAPGTDPHFKNETIIAGAHLDHIGRIGKHIYNGANDDASGCVALLGAARAIAAKRCKRPVLFVFYTGEELNLLGSRYFMEHPPIPVQHMLMNINLEQVGSQHRSFHGIWALGSPEFRNAFFQSGVIFPEQDLNYSSADSVLDILSNTDSYSFMKKDVPSLLLGSGGFPEHHSILDKIDLIDFEHLNKARLLLTTLIYDLGNGLPGSKFELISNDFPLSLPKF